jgi:hypothetical protein
MTGRHHPPLKCPTHTTSQPSHATPARTPAGRSAPKVAARKGVLSVLGLDPHPPTRISEGRHTR